MARQTQTALQHPNLDGVKIQIDKNGQAPLPPPLTEGIRRAYDYIYALRSQVDNLGASSQNVVSTGGGKSTVQNVFLSAGSNTITPSPASPVDGDFLTIITHQPTAGGGLVTWSSTFVGVTSNDNMATPNAVNRYLFVSSTGFWNLVGLPVLGK